MDPSPSTWWRSQPSIAPQLTIPGSCEPGLATVAGPSTERDRHVTRDADTFVPSTAGEARDVLAEQQVIVDDQGDELYYRTYRSEREDMEGIMRLVDQELSEPYNIYTFRYFLVEWPHLTFLVFPAPDAVDPIATIICKQESHRGKTNRGYIGMLSVDQAWRRRGIATKLVKLAISEMASRGAHEIVLETEYDNASSLALYDTMGFMREKRIQRFYSNLKDALRLILPLPAPQPPLESGEEASVARAALSNPPAALHAPELPTPSRAADSSFNHDDLYT